MVSLAAYKIALIVVLAGVPTAFGVSAYYYQQQSTTLTNHLSSLTSQLNATNNDVAGLKNQLSSANSQVSSLSNQIKSVNGQLSQLQSQNSQLQSQVNLLQSQLTGHNQLQVSTVSLGQVSLSSNNGFQQVGFSVPPNAVERLNITFSTTSQGCRGSAHIGSMFSRGLAFQSDTVRQILELQLHSIWKLYDLSLVFAYSNKLHYSDSDSNFWSVDSCFLSRARGILYAHDTSQ